MSEVVQDRREEFEKRYRATAVIVLAQIFSVLLLIGIAWFLAPRMDSAVTPQAITMMWATVLFIAIGTFILRRVLFSWERLKNITLLKGVSGLLGSLQTNSIIINSLAEIVAIIGFLIATLSGNKFEMFRAGAIALIVFLLNFPRKSVWEKILVNAEKI